MSNQFKKAIIDDIVPHKIEEGLQINLLDLFESAMKSVATTLIREAHFETSDFATAKMRNCEGFSLQLKKIKIEGTSAWLGTYQRGEQHLTVCGHLE